MGINWTEIIMSICAILVTGVFVPCLRAFIKNEKATMSKQTQETIEYWVEIGVRWAKQWLQSDTGEEKKAAVFDYLVDKFVELGIDVTEDDLDKLIEYVYEQVKAEEAA